MKVNEKQLAKANAIAAENPWMGVPLKVVELRKQRREFESCIKKLDKALALIAPPPKGPTMGQNDGLGK